MTTKPHVIQMATGEIALMLRITPEAALVRLQALGRVPRADLALLQTIGPRVQQATARPKWVSALPPADLAYLQANASSVSAAVRATPRQCQRWWWICFLARLVFLPLTVVLTNSRSSAHRPATRIRARQTCDE